MSDVSKQRTGEYVARINRVMDYIENHLTEDLRLETLAEVACFSAFHFHRIFAAMTGETLNRYIRRLRLESAATQLLASPDKSVTAVALDSGFSGSASFARAFKEQFGISASQWREAFHDDQSNIRKTDSNLSKHLRNCRKDLAIESIYIEAVTPNQIWRIEMESGMDFKVEVRELPAMEVAYVRHVGPYKGNGELFAGLFEKLMKWAAPRGLIRFPESKLFSVYHDNPDITDEEKLRTSVCLTVPPETKADGEIGRMTVPGGRYAMGRFRLSETEYQNAWDMMFGAWLPESGYQPAEGRPAMEFYYNDPHQDPEGKMEVDIVIPVKPM